jgi:serine/threonine protein kinase
MIEKNTLKVFTEKYKIAEGGEGNIYADKKYVYKLFKDQNELKTKERKVNYLIQTKLPKECIIPIDTITNNGSFIGYSMNKINNCEEIRKLSNKKFITIEKITVKDISDYFVKIGNTLDSLHKNKIYVGDLNDQNILIDKNNVYLIDTDSWSINGIPCTVAMDGFKDPQLVGSNFNEKTDYYSYAVLLFKSLFRVHPYGGVMNPDMPMMDRIKKGISIIGRNDILLPAIANNFNFISPQIMDRLKTIFNDGKRIFILSDVVEFDTHLKLCVGHGDFYFDSYTTCPVCNDKADLVIKPVMKDSISDIPYRILIERNDIKIIINERVALLDSGEYYGLENNRQVYIGNNKYVDFLSNAIIMSNGIDTIQIFSLDLNRKKYRNFPI